MKEFIQSKRKELSLRLYAYYGKAIEDTGDDAEKFEENCLDWLEQTINEAIKANPVEKPVMQVACGQDDKLTTEESAKVIVDAMEWVREYCEEIRKPELLKNLDLIELDFIDLVAMLLDFRNSFVSKPSA